MNDPEILLDIRSKSQADKMHLGKTIGAEMNADPDPEVAGAGAQLLATSNGMETTNTSRTKAKDDAEKLTEDLADQEETWGERFKKAAETAMRIYPKNDNKWIDFGFEKADVELTKRPKPPKVTGLQVTQGDAQGEADLVWNPQDRKTIDGYYLQINTVDPNDLTKWLSAKPISVSASKATIVQLTQGVKYWVRVIPFVGQTEGDPSDEKDVIAP